MHCIELQVIPKPNYAIVMKRGYDDQLPATVAKAQCASLEHLSCKRTHDL